MTFLPVVERELQVASRRRSTYRTRWWTAAVAIVISLFSGMLIAVSGGAPQGGAALFSTLTGYAFGLCVLAGVFLTADSLSREKREGTLGLLFLTDLKGYDIVLGKFMATSVNAVCALVAMLPAIGLSLLFGGVTGGEFWRVCAALLNACFVSLAAGMAVSAFMQDSQRAMGNTLGLLLLLCVALPLAQALFPMKRLPLEPGWLSPFEPFRFARDAYFVSVPGRFFRSIAVSHLLGWFMLGLASWRVPHLARDENAAHTGKPGSQTIGRANAQSAHPARPARAKLLEKNPVLWLASSEPAATWLAWSAAIAWLGTVMLGSWSAGSTEWIYPGARVCGFILKLLIGVQACRFFVQARQNGVLEMLATTPLSNDDILRGQWLALRHLFLWPCLILLGTFLVPAVVSLVTGIPNVSIYRDPTGLWLNFPGVPAVFWFLLTFAADAFALVFVGMWLSLSMRRFTLAPAVTILVVLVLPSLFCLLGVFIDVLLLLWAWNRLQQDFRNIIATHS
jgi:ABC-type transport system involved in multi-copper enzyme maturation permease subunit